MCPFELLDLHLLESRFREEVYGLIKASCGLINSQVQVKICRRGASPVLVYGGGSCESSPKRNRRKVVHLEEMKIIFIDFKWIKSARQRLIQGPKQPGNDIDVYLRPLVEELLDLWQIGRASCRERV